MKNDLYISEAEHNNFLKENSYEGKMKILLKHSEKNNLRIKEKGIISRKEIYSTPSIRLSSQQVTNNQIKGEIMAEKKENFFKKAFREMGENAKAQHEVDKANLEAIKAESKATFEENRGTNTLKKAKAIGKQSWEEARRSPQERTAKTRESQAKQIEEAKVRTQEANARYEKAKVCKKKK